MIVENFVAVKNDTEKGHQCDFFWKSIDYSSFFLLFCSVI